MKGYIQYKTTYKSLGNWCCFCALAFVHWFTEKKNHKSTASTTFFRIIRKSPEIAKILKVVK